jgi:predicted transcriptional regulator
MLKETSWLYGRHAASLIVAWMLATILALGYPSLPAQAIGSGPTDISGIISGNVTWTLDESPFIVKGNLLVENGATLTIEPGVEVRFDGEFYLKVQGALVALGNQTHRIIFTSNKDEPSPGDWKSIEFTHGSNDQLCTINYCEIHYAINGVEINDASPTISFSNIARYSFCGIKAGSSSSCNPNINNNTIIGGEIGILCTKCPANISDNRILKNTRNGIFCDLSESPLFIINNDISNNFHGIYSWVGSPYIIHNTITGNENGIFVRSSEGWIWNNTILKNGDGIHIAEDCELNITYNNVLMSRDFEVRCENQRDVYAPYNFWGTNNTTEIMDRIFDFYDDFNFGKFIFMPILIEPNLGAPNFTYPTINDADSDGIPDDQDAFPNDPSEWRDSDNDGVGDNSDLFPDDPREWGDSDCDGVGDNSDLFPNDPGEWRDSDSDGVGDNSDLFPDDPREWRDSDSDGVGDNSDLFPNDGYEWSDTDEDGVGDNSDMFPRDPSEWIDSDEDGHGDNSDAFPNDRAASKDSDSDGYPDEWNEGMSASDSDTGLTLDEYPNDPSKWREENGSDVVILFVAVIGALSLVCLLAIGITEVGKAKLFAFAFPMYSRFKGEEVLDQFTRGQVYGVIRSNPGINYSKIREVLQIGNGTLSYHLSVLEKEGFIKSNREGLNRLFFPTKLPARFQNLEERFPTGEVVSEGIKLSSVQEHIVSLVSGCPGITQSEIVSKLQIPKQTVSYNVRHLADYGMIEVLREGNTVKCYPSE